jgi:hypothetical protein
MMAMQAWQPSAKSWHPAEPALPPGLAAAMAEKGTIIVLVVGTGPDLDQAERRCRGLALDPGFEEVRVVRVRDRSELSGTQRAYWLAGDRPLSVLGPNRRMALPLERPDAIDLFVAVAALA